MYGILFPHSLLTNSKYKESSGGSSLDEVPMLDPDYKVGFRVLGLSLGFRVLGFGAISGSWVA